MLVSWIGLQDLLSLLLRRAPAISTIKQHFNIGGLIHAAAIARDLSSLQILFETGADIDKRDEKGASALHIAIMSNSVGVVKFLVKA
jgi:ankyrin repeat protein